MQGSANRYFHAYSLLELMVVVAIVASLSAFAFVSYQQYLVRSNIAALIPLADQAKNAVEDEHNQGTIFGASGTEIFVADADTAKPFALANITRVAYGCVNVKLDLAALKLDTSKILIITWCPTENEGSVEWKCGYDSTSFSSYLKYLPSNCQAVNTSIRDTSF